MSQILLVSSEKTTSAILVKLLKTEGYKITPASDPSKARDLIQSEKFNLMITTVGKAEAADPIIEIIRDARIQQPAMPVIAIVENDGGVTKGRLSELHLLECIEKPLKVEKLVIAVQKAVDVNDALLAENVNLNLQLEACYQFDNVVAESQAMKSVCDMISRVAGTDVTILVSGEHGTGKELIARTVHANSRRKDKVMMVVDCSNADSQRTLFGPDGIEKASGGSLILSDINELPQTVQQTLFKCLQERKYTKPGTTQAVPVDVRVIATTSANLQQLVNDGKFLSDLYRLIKIIYIQIPPLRDRRQDIMPIIRQVLRKKIGDGKALPVLESEVTEILQKYSWPGNTSEIDRVLGSALAAASGGKITKANLPPEVVNS